MQAHKRARRLFLAVGALSLCSAVSAQTNVTWSLGANGNWNVASNWSGGVIPNNGSPTGSTYFVFIDGGQAYNCTVNINSGQSYTVSKLSISSGDFLSIGTGGTLALAGGGTISNAGTIEMGAGTLLANTSTVTLSGGGTVMMNGSRLVGTGILHNLDNRIIGYGTFGANNNGLINAGTITITASSLIDPSSTEHFYNSGLVDVTAGTLTLTGANTGSFYNTGGTFTVQNGAMLAFQTSARFSGGTISTVGTGSVALLATHTGTFESIANLGQFVSGNASNTYMLGTWLNNGSISINSTGSATDVLVPAALSFSGSGTLNLNASQVMLSGGGTLSNGSGHTIRGLGNLGNNTTAFINDGRIVADVSAGTLTIDPQGGTTAFVNNGTLQASGGGILSLTGAYTGDFDNTTGRIEALNASTVSLISGAKIMGGTLSTSGSGNIVVSSTAGATFADLTNLGNVSVLSSSNLYLNGTIVNNGSINVTSTGTNTDLEVTGAATLSGTGTVSLTHSAVTVVGGGTLTNSAAHTIRGVGSLGTNTISCVNFGRLVADVPGGTLAIDPQLEVDSFLNSGTLQATGGGILTLSGLYEGDFANAQGHIEALNGSTVSLILGARVQGGTLSTSGTGSIAISSSTGGTLESVTNLGHVVALNATNLYLIGTIVNQGSISITSTGTNTDLEIPSETTLTGSGTLNLGHSAVTVVGGGVLTNGSAHTIRGIGSLGTNVTSVINNGTVLQDVGSGTLIIDPAGTSTGFTNNGVVRVMSGGTIDLAGAYSGDFIGTGSYVVQAGAVLRASNSAIVSTALINNDGTLLISGDSVDAAGIAGTGVTSLSSGVLAAGYIRQSTLSIGTGRTATIKPGGTTASTSKVNTFTLGASAKFDLNDNALIVDYSGASPFATIRTAITTGYASADWSGNGIITTAGATDKSKAIAYAEASATSFTTAFRGQSFAGGDAVLLMYTLRGDVNLDRAVDSLDFNAFTPNYGIKDGSAIWTKGDFDYNGKINTIDFNYLAGNFGTALPSAGDVPGVGAVVPEPGLISAFVGVAVLHRRRRT